MCSFGAFEMGSTVVPLHKINLSSNVVTGTVHVGTAHVGVRKSLPIPGVTFILGNDIGLGNIWGKDGGEVLPQVAKPDPSLVHECVQQHPKVFPACAVTRAMAKKRSDSSEGEERLSSPVEYDSSDSFSDLSDSFLVTLDDSERAPESSAHRNCAGSNKESKEAKYG